MISKIKDSIKKRLLAYSLKGSNVQCLCCGGKFITFLPGGISMKRANALCPHCRSLERHRLIWHYLRSKTDLFDVPKKMLHVAPELLFYKMFRDCKNLDYTPCAKFGDGYTDHYPEGTVNIDITDIKLPDNSFDVIICSHVLEHIPDDAKAMHELHRVLRPGGWAILQVPLDNSRDVTYEDFSITDPKERIQHFGQHDHVRVYGRDYEERLTQAGFQVKRDKFAYEYSREQLFSYGIIPEDIFMCTK